MNPEPVTPPSEDFGRRAQSANDLELTLVRFFQNLFKSSPILDNPTLNLAQPDVVPFDPDARALADTLKAAPRIIRGRVPRTVTGEILLDRLPDCPAIIIQLTSAHVAHDVTHAKVCIYFTAYDEHPNSAGYQDVLNMMETAALALTSFGQAGIDKAYPIIMPIEWKLIEADTHPHYLGEMTTQWELPSARPLPDPPGGIIPGESLEFRQESFGMQP